MSEYFAEKDIGREEMGKKVDELLLKLWEVKNVYCLTANKKGVSAGLYH